MKVYHKSDDHRWETPQLLFDTLDSEFGFTLDVCATAQTAKVSEYFTPDDNGLTQSWGSNICWCNPPYSHIPAWLKKGYFAALGGATVVFLIPARPDTKYWWDYVLRGEIRFIKGRLKFGNQNKKSDSAPFPSALVIFYPHLPEDKRQVTWIDYKSNVTLQMRLF